MIIQQLRQKLYEQKNKIGLVGGSIKVEEYDETEHNISAGISLGWNIEIKLQKDFDPIKDKRQKAYARKKKISDGLETLVLHVAGLHEPAHWELPYASERGCPYDIYWHDKILESIKQALPDDKKQHASYVVNAFEDLLINPRCREFNGDFSGQVLFWDNEGVSLKEKGQKTYTPFSEAFVKLNMHLWGDNVDRALLKRHYSNSKEINNAVTKVVKQLNLSENIQDTAVLFDKRKWPEMAEVFVRNLADLLEQVPTERLSIFSENGKSKEGQQDKGQAGNGIEQKMYTREGKEAIAFGRYSSDERKSTNFTDYEQLDSLYRRLARAIPVKVEAMTREQGLQITPLTYRAFDEEKDDLAKIKLSKLFLTDKGVEFAYPNQPLTIQTRSKIQVKSFPNFKMLILDNSGSMRLAPDNSENIGSTSFIPWGDNSKYHYALLGHYGIENFLQRQAIAQYINHGLSLFSSKTRYKEACFLNLDEVRKFALDPDWGNTNIEAEVLSEALKGRESFVLSISDGEIGNWDTEKDNFKELAENNYYAHIQIGPETEFTQDLKSWSIPVFPVGSGQDLAKLMVDLTINTYRRFTRK